MINVNVYAAARAYAVRVVPVVAAVACANPVSAALIAVGVGGVGLWKYSELVQDAVRATSPLINDAAQYAKRKIHAATSAAAQATAESAEEIKRSWTVVQT